MAFPLVPMTRLRAPSLIKSVRRLARIAWIMTRNYRLKPACTGVNKTSLVICSMCALTQHQPGRTHPLAAAAAAEIRSHCRPSLHAR